ncbi:MAG: hypothetical protein ABI707_00870 [Ferruginibacter sp.]
MELHPHDIIQEPLTKNLTPANPDEKAWRNRAEKGGLDGADFISMVI